MKGKNKHMILGLGVLVVSITGLIILTTAPFLSDYENSGNYARIWFNGRWKTKFTVWNSIIINTGTADDFSNFPGTVPILTLIGIITIILGSLYWALLGFAGKDCVLTNRKVPGPISGFSFLLGGIVGFVGTMLFIPFANERIENSAFDYSYAFGFIVSVVVFSLFLLLGGYLAYLTISNKDKKRRSRRRRKR
ncbi:MAG: hypothetical protein GF308_12350 [Candidatus Heimdallarchaeota archaeon]|nr:hypothetical protein [Candidatus Heimdallarchaeota archaeon]